jgi:hypothetical protein
VKPAALLALALLASCGPATPAQAPEPAKEAPSAEPAKEASTAEPAPPEVHATVPAADGVGDLHNIKPAADSLADSLARDLVKAGGRRIAFSASKKRFFVPVDQRAGDGRGLNLYLYDDEGGQREIVKVCQPGECEERLDEIVKDLLPKLSARLSSEGFEPVSAVGWPSGRDEIDVATLQIRLHQDRGRLSVVNGKKSTPLRALGHAPTGEISAVYPVPSAKLLAVQAGGFFLFKLP